MTSGIARHALVILTLLRVLAADSYAWGETDESQKIKKRLSTISQNVNKENIRLRKLEGKRRELGALIEAHEKLVTDARQRRNVLEEELKRTEVNRARLEQEADATAGKVTWVKEQARHRLRGLFLTGRSSPLDRFFQQGAEGDLLRDAFFLKKVTSANKDFILELIAMGNAAASQATLLQKVITSQAQIKSLVEAEELKLATTLARETRLLQDNEDQKARIDQAVGLLRDEAGRLEKIIASLTGKASIKKNEKVASPRSQDGSIGDSSVSLPLLPPVQGRVLQGFGKQKVTGFEDFIFQKGVEFSVEPGKEVQAVAKGTVRYVGLMPGYGNVIIVDHGARDYTLYGRLGKVAVKSGFQMQARQVLGYTGTADYRGRNLYFEIRKGGVPEDPIGYFERRLKATPKNGQGVRKLSGK